MKKQMKRAGMALLGGALLALQGCGTSTVSRSVGDDGVAQEVVFPDIAKSAWLKEGTFPNLDNLRRVAPGQTKDQLYDQLGRPHFREGLSGVREWDYIFNFRTPSGVKTCQYKAIFDKNLLAQSFHWLPANCGDVLKVAAAPVPTVTERVVERVVDVPRRVSLSADALFAFDRSGAPDLLPRGRRELDALAANLRGSTDIGRIDIVGHTDRLGAASYNQRLSEARAMTVRNYLVAGGVPSSGITVQGRGAADPKVQCSQTARQPLIDCLAPNRRVEINVQARP
jgi:OmpA-OmpF porin, OOP family